MSGPADSTTGPGKKSGPDQRSRLMFWFGCAGCFFLLLLIGVGGTFAFLLFRDGNRQVQRTLPEGWRDSIRVAFALPEAAAHLVRAAGPGESAAADLAILMPLPDSSRRRYPSIAQRLTRNLALEPGDADAMTASLRDTTINSLSSLARFRAYDILPRFAEEPGRPRLIEPLGQGIHWRGSMMARTSSALVTRGEARLRRGDRAGARSDFSAALSLGATMWRQEPSLYDLRSGGSLLGQGARGLARVARAAGDSATARDMETLYESASARRLLIWFLLGDHPDSVMLLAADTTLPRGIRIEAIYNATLNSSVSVRGFMFGPPGRIRTAVRGLERDRDPVVARAAVIADSTLTRWNRLWAPQRLRRVARGSR